MMRQFVAPTARADSMYGEATIPSAIDRTVRAAVGVSRTTSAMMTLLTDWPSAAISASARMMGGSAMTLSTTRWLPVSAAPPRYAVTAPQSAPNVMPKTTDTSPTYSDSRAPQITRLSTSRPTWSVPMGNSALGGRYGAKPVSLGP